MNDTTKKDVKDEAAKADRPAGPRFAIHTPVAGFRGERFGVRLYDGYGTTDDEAAARACGDCGYQVTDLRTGKVLRNPLPEPAAPASPAAKRKA